MITPVNTGVIFFALFLIKVYNIPIQSYLREVIMIAVNSKAAVITLCLKLYHYHDPNKYLISSFDDDLKIFNKKLYIQPIDNHIYLNLKQKIFSELDRLNVSVNDFLPKDIQTLQNEIKVFNKFNDIKLNHIHTINSQWYFSCIKNELISLFENNPSNNLTFFDVSSPVYEYLAEKVIHANTTSIFSFSAVDYENSLLFSEVNSLDCCSKLFNTFKEKKSVLQSMDNLFVFPDFSRYSNNIAFSVISKYYVNTVSKLIKYTKYKAVIALPLRLAMSTESALIDFRKNLIFSGHLACLQGLPLNYFYLNNTEYVLILIDKTKNYSKTYVTSNYADNIDLSSNNPFYKLDPDFLLNPRNSNVKSKTLDDVCTIYKALTCKQITYEEYLNLDTKKDAEYSAYKELSLKDVPDTGIILNADKNIYIKKDLKQLQRNLLKKGDLVLSVKGSVGKVGYFNSSRTDVSAGQIFVIIRPKEYSVLSSEALFYILKSKVVQDYIKSVTLKSAPKVLQLTDLKALPLKNSLFADAKSLKLKGQDLIKQLTYAQNELNKLSVAINELNDGVII